jgi:hypothetical protein
MSYLALLVLLVSTAHGGEPLKPYKPPQEPPKAPPPAQVRHEPQNPCDMLQGQAQQVCLQTGVHPRDLSIYFYDRKNKRHAVPLMEADTPCPALAADGEFRLFRSASDHEQGKPALKTVRCRKGRQVSSNSQKH